MQVPAVYALKEQVILGKAPRLWSRTRGIARALSTAVLMTIALPAFVGQAGVICIDVNAFGSTPVYSGSDGVLSGSGTYWNWLPPHGGIYNLKDETGTQTDVTIEIPWLSYFTNLSMPTNCPQRSAAEFLSGTYMDISSLASNADYDIAVYMGAGNTEIWGFGTWQTSSISGPTGAMPGVPDRDYLLFSNIESSSNGVISIYVSRTIGAVNGVVAGIQLRGTLSAPTQPMISVEPKYIPFGDVPAGSMSSRSFTVTNEGVGMLVGRATVGPTSVYEIISGAGYSLSVGQSQTVTVQFSPDELGFEYAAMTFTGGGGARRELHGTGVQPPVTMAQPIFSGVAINNGNVFLTVSDLTLDATNYVRRSSSLKAQQWDISGTFISTSSETNWSEAFTPAQMYYRIQSH